MTMKQTSASFTHLLLVIFFCWMTGSEASGCFGVRTYNGVVNLGIGEGRCAETEDVENKGKSYVQCTLGGVETRNCSVGTRYSNQYRVCAWTVDCGSRPAADTTPTPTTGSPDVAVTCDSANCQLPDCFCYGAVPAVSHAELPMFILLSFDDAVTSQVFQNVYREMLVDRTWGIRNPNKCGLRSTFFINNEYTDYTLVNRLYQAGHEIASHGVNHTTQEETFHEVADEIVGMRDIIASKTGVPANEVTGFRSPYLQLFKDHQFDVLSHYNFTYDSSITNVELIADRKPLWPFTLDFPIDDNRCPNKCPKEGHPGVWEVPMNGWVGNNGHSCGMIDGCSIVDSNVTGTFDEYMNYFQSNFYKFYEHKVPMHMFTHGSMLMKDEDALPALKAFFEYLMAEHDDVWFTTPATLIEWMKAPTNNTQMLTDPRFEC